MGFVKVTLKTAIIGAIAGTVYGYIHERNLRSR